ncbi:MAG: hypothetical protein J6X58_02560 [Bacteroidales bacterium]|nr:hypothetical protein [Bacteroidales bacterium]
MKTKAILSTIILATILAVGCNAEKKIETYSEIYSERPVTIYLAPINDKAERKVEKYPSDEAYNNELNTAKAYMYQTLASPLVKRGYYVIGPVASAHIAEVTNLTPKQLRNGDLKSFSNDYGIDAILIVTLHKWIDDNEKKTAYLEYQLRSTKSNTDMMHIWVMATKAVTTNLKGDPIKLKNDTKFAKRFDIDNGSAQRSFLLEKVNDYILRNLPTSSQRRQFEKDMYKASNPTYIKYLWMDGGADVQECSAEEYESQAFL